MKKSIIIIGASHAGTSLAFALRKEGWQANIILIEKDPNLPYHRPPLSKKLLTSDMDIDQHLLMARESYDKHEIDLRLGLEVTGVDKSHKAITLSNGIVLSYDKLVLATGATPFIPPIKGIKGVQDVFYLRTAKDAMDIRSACRAIDAPSIVIIGGGYIGLECAASLKQLDVSVTILERENRLLSRVTAPEMSDFFLKLHTEKGVEINLNKNVTSIERAHNKVAVLCDDGAQYDADLIIVGVGVSPNVALAEHADLKTRNGICVDEKTQTSDPDIYAIGDCTEHYNKHYDTTIRLESVQNAVDQAKVAAKAICKKETGYDAVPWFWSDQYDVKLQMVGLSSGYTEAVVRTELSEDYSFSIWYFKDDELLAVDAANSPKAYVLGSKFIKARKRINKSILIDAGIPLKPANLILKETEIVKDDFTS